MESRNRIPIVGDASELQIPWQTFATVIAGNSIIDIEEFNVSSVDQAMAFVKSYGLDYENPHGRTAIEAIVTLAKNYVRKQLLPFDNYKEIPEQILAMSIIDLMICAGDRSKQPLSSWACLILKVCHASAHAKWTHDTEAHAAALALLRQRYDKYILKKEDGLWIGDDNCMIPLHEFSIKSNKKVHRVITKLLHKKGNLSQKIWDRIGIRLITTDIFSAILLIRFLRTRSLFMYVNALPGEAKNSIAEFSEIQEIFQAHSPLVHIKAANAPEPEPEQNRFSHRDFKMIKLIERLLVELPSGRRVFFPYEIQILIKSGSQDVHDVDKEHHKYVERQIEGVRERLFVHFPKV